MNKSTHSKPIDVRILDIRCKVYCLSPSFQIRTMADIDACGIPPTVHSHFTYEMFFVTEGAMDLTIGNQTGTYRQAVLTLPPKVKHYAVPEGNGCFSLLFSFEEARQPNRYLAFLQEYLQQGLCQLPLTEDIVFYIRKLSKKSTSDGPTTQQDMAHLASLLLAEVFFRFLPSKQILQPAETGNARHIYAIETYINSHCHQKVTLADLAAVVSLSTRQVSRIILKEYGCSLSQLVVEKRLSSAEQLIRNSDLSIEQIASQSGLGSVNYFYVVFKNRFGLSPLQYRKQHSL